MATLTYTSAKETIPAYPYNMNARIINKWIKSYNLAGTELFQTPDRFFLDKEITHIKANFAIDPNNLAGRFLRSDIVVVLVAEVFEKGGIVGRTRISSIYNVNSTAWWKSVDTSNKTKLTFTGGNGTTTATNVLAEAYLDYSKLPAGIDAIMVYARLFEGLARDEVVIVSPNNGTVTDNMLQSILTLKR